MVLRRKRRLDMKAVRSVLVMLGATALLVGTAAAPALADTKVPLTGGTTSITTSKTVLPALTANGILMKTRDGASSTFVRKVGGPMQQRFMFPIVSPSAIMLQNDPQGKLGTVTGGVVNHRGDLQFFNVNNGRQITLGDFRVSIKSGRVLATTRNGDPMNKPIAVFKITFVKTPVYPKYDNKNNPTRATISGIKLTLTPRAGAALNDALRISVFPTDGSLLFGTAKVSATL
jgi:hypothetical protein